MTTSTMCGQLHLPPLTRTAAHRIDRHPEDDLRDHDVNVMIGAGV